MTQQFNRQGVASTLLGDLGFNDFLEAPVLEMESALEPAAGQLEKLLLFGTKIVTLFGQRKNVFVKQKHSGQNLKCAVHEKTTVCGNTSVLFLIFESLW